jgi:hypothetical protein
MVISFGVLSFLLKGLRRLVRAHEVEASLDWIDLS